MIRWILVLSQQHSPDDLRRKLQIQHIEEMISWDSRRILDAGGALQNVMRGGGLGGIESRHGRSMEGGRGA